METNNGSSYIHLTIEDTASKKKWDGSAGPREKLGEIATAAAIAMGTQTKGKVYFLGKNGIQLLPDLTVERSTLRNGDVLELLSKNEVGATLTENKFKLRLSNEFNLLQAGKPSEATIEEYGDDKSAPLWYIIQFTGFPCYATSGGNVRLDHKIKLVVDRKYPYTHPVITAESPIYHPNVWPKDHPVKPNVYCLYILHDDQWVASNSILDVVKDIPKFFGTANEDRDDAANPEAFDYWKKEGMPGKSKPELAKVRRTKGL